MLFLTVSDNSMSSVEYIMNCCYVSFWLLFISQCGTATSVCCLCCTYKKRSILYGLFDKNRAYSFTCSFHRQNKDVIFLLLLARIYGHMLNRH